MTRKSLYRALNMRIPRSYSEGWDNDGAMLFSNPDKEVKNILCTLDVSDDVIDYAKENGVDLIVSHHPLIFNALKALDGYDPTSRRVLKLVEADIAVFSFHTRLDAMGGGINDSLADALGLSKVKPIDDFECMIGRIGEFPSPMSIDAFCALVKEVTGAPFVNALVKKDAVRCVAIVGGEGKDFISQAKDAGADTYLSGRLGYHAMIDGEINLIECGHYFSEKHAALLLADIVKMVLPRAEIKIYAPNSLRVY